MTIGVSVESVSVSESVLVSESGNSIGFTKDKKRPNKRAINPTSKAAITVPSRTPANLPANTKERTPAITVIDTSKQILVTPNSVCHVITMARTKDSPGSIATLASTSVYTPNPRIRHPISR